MPEFTYYNQATYQQGKQDSSMQKTNKQTAYFYLPFTLKQGLQNQASEETCFRWGALPISIVSVMKMQQSSNVSDHSKYRFA